MRITKTGTRHQILQLKMHNQLFNTKLEGCPYGLIFHSPMFSDYYCFLSMLHTRNSNKILFFFSNKRTNYVYSKVLSDQIEKKNNGNRSSLLIKNWTNIVSHMHRIEVLK